MMSVREWLIPAVILALCLFWLFRLRVKKPRSIFLRILNVALAVLLFLLATLSTARLWFLLRPQPAPITLQIHPAIQYLREVRKAPRPVVIHTLLIDLNNSHVQIVTTPPSPTGEFGLRAQTTSEFLIRNRLLVAVNGDFFYPWHYKSIFDYYPHDGDGVNTFGSAISQGISYARGQKPPFSTVYFTKNNQVFFDSAPPDAFEGISGHSMVMRNGVIPEEMRSPAIAYYSHLHPRTALGLTQSGRRLILMVIDGRQPGYSMGATVPELTSIMQEHGATSIMNLDGGGSSTMAMADENGKAILLNSPIQHHWPGTERPVANHIGVRIVP